MKAFGAAFVALLSAVPALAAVAEWGQCGGNGWTYVFLKLVYCMGKLTLIFQGRDKYLTIPIYTISS
jgi:hypothetical protein